MMTQSLPASHADRFCTSHIMLRRLEYNQIRPACMYLARTKLMVLGAACAGPMKKAAWLDHGILERAATV